MIKRFAEAFRPVSGMFHALVVLVQPERPQGGDDGYRLAPPARNRVDGGYLVRMDGRDRKIRR